MLTQTMLKKKMSDLRTSMKTLLILSHTYWENSKVNKALAKEALGLDYVKVHNINELYKDGKIDAEKEIELLKEAEFIVF